MKKLLVIISALVLFNSVSLAHDPYYFIHITDPHIADSWCPGSYDRDGEVFAELINVFRKLDPKPDFIIASGDISHEGAKSPDGMYPQGLTRHLYQHGNPSPPGSAKYYIDSNYKIPIYFTPGNHDYRISNIPDLSLNCPFDPDLEYYRYHLEDDRDYYVIHKDLLLLLMDSGHDRTCDYAFWMPEGSGFSDDQMSWMENYFYLLGSLKKVIVMHHPPANALGIDWDGGAHSPEPIDVTDGSISTNRPGFLDLCDDYDVKIVCSGHIHQYVVCDENGNVIDENCTSKGTRYVQTANAYAGCYRKIWVNGSSVNVSDPLRAPVNPKKGKEQRPWADNEYGTLYKNKSYDKTMGYHFAPEKDGYITSLGGYFKGTKTVKLWNLSTGEELSSVSVKSSNKWAYEDIMAVPVNAGVTYTVAAYMEGSGASYRTNLSFPKTYSDITIEAGTYRTGNNRPTAYMRSRIYGQVDIGFCPEKIGQVKKIANNIKKPELPKHCSLSSNYPNPFNPATTISYSLPEKENVNISVYNINGKLVQILVNACKEAGSHNAIWNGKDQSGNTVSSGVYFYRINAGNFSETKRMLLVK